MAPTRRSESLKRWPVAGLIIPWRFGGVVRELRVWGGVSRFGNLHSAWTWWRLGFGGFPIRASGVEGFRLPRFGASSLRALFVGCRVEEWSKKLYEGCRGFLVLD